MEQNHQHFSLSEKEHAVINHMSGILRETLSVQQEILAQLTLLNNRVLTMEHRMDQIVRDARAKEKP
jgi:hypothetical protein